MSRTTILDLFIVGFVIKVTGLNQDVLALTGADLCRSRIL